MSVGLREDILQDVRDWVVPTTGATAAEVVYARDDRPKIDKPHLLVRELSHFSLVGSPERRRRNNNGTIEERIWSKRETTYQLDAMGIDALPWLETLGASRWRSDVRATLSSLAINPLPVGSISDTSAIVAERYERRATQDWRVEYEAVSDWYAISSEITEVRITGHLRDYPDQPDADALDIDYTLTD